MAGGLRMRAAFSKEKSPEINGTDRINIQNLLHVGPFVRYYFLPVDNRINLLAETGIFIKKTTIKPLGGATDAFKEFDYSFATGPVIFLNEVVGMEFLLSYYLSKAKDFDAKNSNIRFNIGFQIH